MNNVQIFMTPEDAIDKRSSHALVIEDVKGLFIQDWQSALVLKNVSDFEIRSFSGRQGLVNRSNPTILLENISEGLIAESKAEAGCNTFIRVSKAESKNVALRNNNTTKATKPVSY